MAIKYRVGVIGSTGRGNYGHGLDTVWQQFQEAKVIAVADDNSKGLANAVNRLDNPKGYKDYRKMLENEKLDFVSICPRWLDQHRDMLVASAEAGVKGIFQEKPLCQTLQQADEMIDACEKNEQHTYAQQFCLYMTIHTCTQLHRRNTHTSTHQHECTSTQM